MKTIALLAFSIFLCGCGQWPPIAESRHDHGLQHLAAITTFSELLGVSG